MKIIPNKTKYHLKFRNKIRTRKIFKHDLKQINPYGRSHLIHTSIANDLNSLIPMAPFMDHMDHSMTSTVRSSKCDDFTVKTSCHNHEHSIALQIAKILQPSVSYDYASAILFGTSAIICETHATLSAKFIQTIHLDIVKLLKKKSRLWLRLCCDTPVTARPVDTRMGKGKGAISYWETKVFPGQVFFEFTGLTLMQSQQILRHVVKKSPVALKLIANK